MRGNMVFWLVGALCLASIAPASIVAVDLRGSGGAYDFDAPSGSSTILDGGLQLQFQSRVNGLPGDAGDWLNATASGFGLNESGSGDDPDEFDFVNGQESVLIQFDLLGSESLWGARLTEFRVGQFGSGEEGFYRLNGGAPVLFFSTGTIAIPSQPSVNGLSLEVGDASGAGNGFSLVSLGFETLSMPEPTSAGFLLMGSSMLYGLHRIRHRFSIVRFRESC